MRARWDIDELLNGLDCRYLLLLLHLHANNFVNVLDLRNLHDLLNLLDPELLHRHIDNLVKEVNLQNFLIFWTS